MVTVDRAAEENASLDDSEDRCSSTIVATEEMIANVMTTTCTLECYVVEALPSKCMLHPIDAKHCIHHLSLTVLRVACAVRDV